MKVTFTEMKSLRFFDVDLDDESLYFELIMNGEKVQLNRFKWSKQNTDYESITLPTINQYSVADIYCVCITCFVT